MSSDEQKRVIRSELLMQLALDLPILRREYFKMQAMLTDQELKTLEESFDSEIDMGHEAKDELRKGTLAIDASLQTMARASGCCGPIAIEQKAEKLRMRPGKLRRVCC